MTNSFKPISQLQIDSMNTDFTNAILSGSNNPPTGSIVFDSSDHIRFQNGQDVSGHNYGCNRRLVIDKNIQGDEGYTVTLYNMDGIHPLWQNNIQMAPKRMKIVNVDNNLVELRGYGCDENALAMGVPIQAASFENYGVVIMMRNNEIVRAQLNMFDRNTCIVYVK